LYWQDATKVRERPQTLLREVQDMREKHDVHRLDFHLVSPVTLIQPVVLDYPAGPSPAVPDVQAIDVLLC
jgi:hypothetical protein